MVRRPLDFFAHIFVINLKSRPDRRRQTVAAFQRAGIDPQRITWFDAVRPDAPYPFDSIGAHGCFMSHLGVLETATEMGISKVLILEDDIEFAREFGERFVAIEGQLRERTWDFFYGGGVTENVQRLTPQLAQVPCDQGIMLAHFVAVQGDAIGQVARYIRAQLGRPPGSPEGGPMHVDGSYCWARRDLRLTTLIADPPICTQRSSRSDITPSKRWERNLIGRLVADAARCAKRFISKATPK